MANQFLTLSAPPANGPGPTVATDGLAAFKTFIAEMDFDATLIVEASGDGVTFSEVCRFSFPGGQNVPVAAPFMRLNVADYVSGLPNVDIGAAEGSIDSALLPAPAGDGTGASVNIASFLGTFNTVYVTEPFSGVLVVQVSADGVDWADEFTFSSPGIQSRDVVAQFVRVVRKATGGGLAPTVYLANTTSGAGGGSSSVSSNVLVPQGTGLVTRIYVRPGGDDLAGDGSLGAPYETLARGLEDVPAYVPGGVNYDSIILDITGIDEDVSVSSTGNGLPIPTVDGAKADIFPAPVSPVDAGFSRSLLNIQAQMVDVLTSLPVASVSVDPLTSLDTITLTGTPLTPGAHVGQFVRADSGKCYPIDRNTASEIFVTSIFETYTSVDIVDTGATLRNSTSSTFATLQRTGGNAHLNISGVEILAPSGTAATGFRQQEGGAGSVLFESSRVEGSILTTRESGFFSSVLTSVHNLNEARAFISQSFLWNGQARLGSVYGGQFNFLYIRNFEVFVGEQATDGNEVGSIMSGVFQNFESNDSPGDGFKVYNSAPVIKLCRISTAAGSGIDVEGPMLSEIRDVQGVGNGIVGVRLNNGAQVRQSGVLPTITGASGDLIIGALLPTTWAAFSGAPTGLNDIGAGNLSQLCRMF